MPPKTNANTTGPSTAPGYSPKGSPGGKQLPVGQPPDPAPVKPPA